MRVALVHDYLNQYGGAERVLEALHEIYPDAPVFTSLYDPDAMPDRFRSWEIRTSFLQRMPLVRRFHRAFLLLYPPAFESFDFRDFDVVISNSSSWAKSVITPPDTLHVCYCLTPMRWAWNYRDYLIRENLGRPIRRLLPVAIHYLRMWDAVTSSRVDRFIGISRAVVARIRKYRARLESLAGPTVRFRGHVSDTEVHEALASCRAFLFPGEEDFGIAPVEAMAAGRPVVAYAGGGALDTVVDGITGRLFSPQSVDALADRLARFDPNDFDPRTVRDHALRFDTRSFQDAIGAYVERDWDEACINPVARWERAPV